jgi:O-antigen ligase
VIVRVLRVLTGAVVACFTIVPLSELPLLASGAAIVVMALTLWRTVVGLTAVIALAPAGLLLAPPPARAAELLVWAFLAMWLLSLWRPLSATDTKNPTLLPALLYALCAVASWLAYTVGGAGGIEPLYLPATVARAVPVDHLLFSSPEPETFTLLPLLAGVALFVAAAVATRERPGDRLALAAAIAGSAAVLSALTIADVIGQWADVEFGGWFLLRYVRGERFSLHLADLNAAGSHYVLGALIAAALAVLDRARRAIWILLAIAIVPALWIGGSRSASAGGLLVGGGLLWFLKGGGLSRVPAGARRAVLLAAVAALAIGAAAVAAQPAEQGTAAHALRLRVQFLVTSARMFASAPIFGVGIGHYHERSNEFMPAALREVYGYENAHNYFAQQFAELGIAGGVLFAWLVIGVLRPAWRAVREDPAGDAASIALLAGTAGYLLTCVTGHPILVPEAAIPFWGAFGALAATARPGEAAIAERPNGTPRRLAIAAAVLVAAANVAVHVRRYALTSEAPGERGFYTLETTEAGRMFVWMTRHGVFYVGPQPGTVSIPVRAPDFLDGTEPFVVAVDVAGRRAGVYEAHPDRWTTIEIPLRRRAAAPFRRVDLRANRSWSPMRDRGERTDDQPRSVMVGETRWTPAGAR